MKNIFTNKKFVVKAVVILQFASFIAYLLLRTDMFNFSGLILSDIGPNSLLLFLFSPNHGFPLLIALICVTALVARLIHLQEKVAMYWVAAVTAVLTLLYTIGFIEIIDTDLAGDPGSLNASLAFGILQSVTFAITTILLMLQINKDPK